MRTFGVDNPGHARLDASRGRVADAPKRLDQASALIAAHHPASTAKEALPQIEKNMDPASASLADARKLSSI
jgi:hypothetical protein